MRSPNVLQPQFEHLAPRPLFADWGGSSEAPRETHSGFRLLPRLGHLAAHIRVTANVIAVPALASVLMQGIVV
jgi:hypothetical protein